MLKGIIDFFTSLFSGSLPPPIKDPEPIEEKETLQTETPWMDWLKVNLGEPVATGTTPTTFNKLTFRYTNYGPLGATMQPGCAATACAALEINGYKSPHNAAAISFKKYGTPCEFKHGAIVVFKWPTGGNHVSFFSALNRDGTISCLGGNQGRKLKYSNYNPKHVIATRWPIK